VPSGFRRNLALGQIEVERVALVAGDLHQFNAA